MTRQDKPRKTTGGYPSSSKLNSDLGPPPATTKRPTRTELQAYFARMPRVNRLVNPVECQGWMTRKIGGCRKPAYWSFKHSKQDWCHAGEVRHYCWQHLIYRGVYGSMEEHELTDKWITKNPPPWSKEKDQ